MLKYASFNTTLEWHILEPQIISITTTFKLLKMLEGGRNNSLSTLDMKKTRNNKLGLEQQRFRLDMGSRLFLISQKQGKWGTRETALWDWSLSHYSSLWQAFTFLRNTIGGDEPALRDARHKISLLLQFYCSRSSHQNVYLKLLGCTKLWNYSLI